MLLLSSSTDSLDVAPIHVAASVIGDWWCGRAASSANVEESTGEDDALGK